MVSLYAFVEFAKVLKINLFTKTFTSSSTFLIFTLLLIFNYSSNIYCLIILELLFLFLKCQVLGNKTVGIADRIHNLSVKIIIFTREFPLTHLIKQVDKYRYLFVNVF